MMGLIPLVTAVAVRVEMTNSHRRARRGPRGGRGAPDRGVASLPVRKPGRGASPRTADRPSSRSPLSSCMGVWDGDNLSSDAGVTRAVGSEGTDWLNAVPTFVESPQHDRGKRDRPDTIIHIFEADIVARQHLRHKQRLPPRYAAGLRHAPD